MFKNKKLEFNEPERQKLSFVLRVIVVEKHQKVFLK